MFNGFAKAIYGPLVSWYTRGQQNKPEVTRSAHQERVLSFNLKAGLLRPKVPTVQLPSLRIARARLIMEEALEVIEAMGVTVFDHYPDCPTKQLSMPDLEFIVDDTYEVYLPDLAKEFADLHVVTTGSEQAFGIDLDEIQQAVDENNLAKFGDGSYLDHNGKWHKPKNHPKPNTIALLERQGWTSRELEDQQPLLKLAVCSKEKPTPQCN